MQIHNTLIWIIVYFILYIVRNLARCSNISPGVNLNSDHSYLVSPSIELKPLEYSSESKDISDSVSNLSQYPKKSIILDINWSFSTDSFSLFQLENVYIYSARNNYTFGSIKEDKIIIWDPGPTEYSNKIKVEKNRKISIHLENGITKVLKRAEGLWIEECDGKYRKNSPELNGVFGCSDVDCVGLRIHKSIHTNSSKSLIINTSDNDLLFDHEKVKDSKDIDGNLSNPFDLKITTIGNSSSNVNNNYYYIKVDPNEEHYIFKQGVKCEQLEINDDLIWRHNVTENGLTYPKSVIYYKTNRLSINFIDHVILFEKVGLNWNLRDNFKNRATNDFYSELENVNFLNKYITSQGTGDNTNTTTPESCFKSLSNYNNNNNKNNKNDNEITKPDETQIKTSDVGVNNDDIKIKTKDDNNNEHENDKNTYELKNQDYGFLYNFKESHKLIELRYGEDEVWKYTNEPKNVYPKSIFLRKGDEIIIFEFENCFYLYGCKLKKFKLISKEDFETVFKNIKVITTHNSQTTENDTNAYEFTHYGLIFKYKFKNDYECKEVKYADTSAWKHEEGNKYPTILYFDIIAPIMINVIIDNKNEVKFFYKKEWKNSEETLKEIQTNQNSESTTPAATTTTTEESTPAATTPAEGSGADGSGKPAEDTTTTTTSSTEGTPTSQPGEGATTTSSTEESTPAATTPAEGTDTTDTSQSEKTNTLKAIELDVNKTKSTESFEYLKKDGFAKYTSKSGYGFSSVKKSSSSCSKSTDDIWSADDSANYATAVVRDGAGLCSSMSIITIFCNNYNNQFTKSDNKWVEVPFIKFYTLPTSSTDTQQIETSKYTEQKSENDISYSFKDGSQCNEVKYVQRTIQENSAKVNSEEVSLWKHDSNKHGQKYPKLLRYYCPDKIEIIFDEFFMILKKGTDGKWDEGLLFEFKLYYKDSRELKELEVTQYELTHEGDEHIFKFKTEAQCSEVRHKGVEL